MSTELTIGRFMRVHPVTVAPCETLRSAHHIMHTHHVRHLPVVDAGQVVGIVSERDLAMVESITGQDPDRLTVESAMTPEPLVVQATAPLYDVVRAMAKGRLGCCVVGDTGHVEGIFTTVDALEALAELIKPA